MVLVDGVKIPEADGWVLIVPDPEEPMTHVWAEGAHRRQGPGPGLRARRAHPPDVALTAPPAVAGVDATAPGPPSPVRRPGRLSDVSGRVPAMQVPDELHYSTDHEWIRQADGRVRIGITDYAQDALGDVVFVSLPALGSHVEAHGILGEVESTKSVSEIYAPVAGEVVAVNEALTSAPEQLNSDPYGEGWICELVPTQPDATAGLLDAAGYTELIAG